MLGLPGTEGNTAFAGAGGVIFRSPVTGAGRIFHFGVKMKQLAAGKGAEFGFEILSKFPSQRKDDFFFCRFAGEVAFAESCYHAKP